MSSDSDDETFNPSQGLRRPSQATNFRGCDESIASTSFSNFSFLSKNKLSLSLRKKQANQPLKIESPKRDSDAHSMRSDHDPFDILNHNVPEYPKSPQSPIIIEELFQEDPTEHVYEPCNQQGDPDPLDKPVSPQNAAKAFNMSISSSSSSSINIPVSQKHVMPRTSPTSSEQHQEVDPFLSDDDDDTDDVVPQPAPKKFKVSRSPSPDSSASTIPTAPKIIVRKSQQVASPVKNVAAHRCEICFISSNIIDESLEEHRKKCQPKTGPPCPSGRNCQSLYRAHYNAYRHELQVHDAPHSSESSILTMILESEDPAESTQALVEAPPQEHLPNMDETVPLEPQNVSPTKIEFIQKWVNSCEIVDDESDRQSITSSNSENVLKPSGASASVVTLEEVVKTGMVTPVKNNRTTGECSSGSKQTSITEFFTPTRSPKAEAKNSHSDMVLATKVEMTRIRSDVIKELCTPALPPPSVPPAAPAPPADNSRAQWSSLMSRMRGTAANVEKELSEQPPKVAEMAKCPFYKRIPNTGFAIDAFSYGPIAGVTSYFLSHFHWDHYRGLGKWLNRPMYCSKITANLVRLKMRAVSPMIRELPLYEPRVIDSVEVVLIDANHCPGSVMFLFRLPSGQTILHTGDFRADKSMQMDKFLNLRPIDHLYLDTTYCNEYYKLPAQSEVIEYVRRLVRQHADKYPKLLVVVGTYTVGKEKVFITAANELNCLIWAPGEKRSILKCLEDSTMSRRLFADPHRCNVHVVNTSDIKAANLTSYYQQFKASFTHILALLPTGWEHDDSVASRGLDAIRPKSYGNIFIYGVPYSEHSSYEELKSFVCHFKPSKIIPHVGVGSAATRKRMEEIFADWKNNGNWGQKNSQKILAQSIRGKSLRPRGGQSKKF